ncbi:alpha/beta hydrolase [Candidatus Galacturonibacter soehngenii]|uniref:Tributyrin esterase n=1 Tax=Candidatus Galacturonatibacter soehngenii TaxID=2307010 RepID=A0A7V7QK79_9FIRM|nr:alpha/beta hydrolase family protein [Candidatus Galacturonibacter soehngenii]KAB1438159.1 tributyrin esterase [Candidatus Galacturonibacter soehngenii]
MASMTCNYYSYTLQHNITINIVIPTPEGNEQITNEEVKKHYRYEEGLPVVYLLHGAYGNYSSWLRFSNVERYAQKHCCALVMASADNSCYQDMKHGNAYATFFTKELPAFIKSIFPISDKREDTFVAGFSMGGYGAWYLALSNPNLYAKAASMSGALDIAKTYEENMKGAISAPFQWTNVFEEPDKLAGSQADLFKLYDNCLSTGIVPDLYQSCGTEDFLYEMNRSVKEKLEQKGASFVYQESEGGHNWDYWDKDIQSILDWMFSKDINPQNK